MEDEEYRAKQLGSSEWIYGFGITKLSYWNKTTKGLELRETIFYTNDGVFSNSEVNSRTVGQYTGLKDKNGKKIYENDYVKTFNSIICKVVFKDGAYGYETEHVGFVSFAENESFNWKNNQSKYLEVIGNIYDNPSLLGNDNAD